MHTVLEQIKDAGLALVKAEEDHAYATHRCITDTQQAHYATKIVAEKEMWGYDKMTEAD